MRGTEHSGRRSPLPRRPQGHRVGAMGFPRPKASPWGEGAEGVPRGPLSTTLRYILAHPVADARGRRDAGADFEVEGAWWSPDNPGEVPQATLESTRSLAPPPRPPPPASEVLLPYGGSADVQVSGRRTGNAGKRVTLSTGLI